MANRIERTVKDQARRHDGEIVPEQEGGDVNLRWLQQRPMHGAWVIPLLHMFCREMEHVQVTKKNRLAAEFRAQRPRVAQPQAQTEEAQIFRDSQRYYSAIARGAMEEEAAQTLLYITPDQVSQESMDRRRQMGRTQSQEPRGARLQREAEQDPSSPAATRGVRLYNPSRWVSESSKAVSTFG